LRKSYKKINAIVKCRRAKSAERPLRNLIKKITPQNRHGEIDFGHSAGKELI